MKLTRGTGRTTSRRFGRKGRIALAVVLVGFASTGAYAYWTTSGSGTGSASAGTLSQITIDDVVIGAALRPNGPARDVTIKLKNPNNFAVDIVSITAGAITSDKSGCNGSATGVTLDLSTVTGSIAANFTKTFTASASMSSSSVTECQGATFSSNLTLVVHK